MTRGCPLPENTQVKAQKMAIERRRFVYELIDAYAWAQILPPRASSTPGEPSSFRRGRWARPSAVAPGLRSTPLDSAKDMRRKIVTRHAWWHVTTPACSVRWNGSTVQRQLSDCTVSRLTRPCSPVFSAVIHPICMILMTCSFQIRTRNSRWTKSLRCTWPVATTARPSYSCCWYEGPPWTLPMRKVERRCITPPEEVTRLP